METSNGTSVQNNNNVKKDIQGPNKTLKTKFWAYFWWLFGGILGAHHVYLGRDDHAIIWFCTIGGYFGIGWLRDLYRIPDYVADANDDHEYLERFKAETRKFKKVNAKFN